MSRQHRHERRHHRDDIEDRYREDEEDEDERRYRRGGDDRDYRYNYGYGHDEVRRATSDTGGMPDGRTRTEESRRVIPSESGQGMWSLSQWPLNRAVL